MTKKTSTNRYPLPDTIRGILVIEMIVYHLLFDLYYLFNMDMPWFSGDGMRLFQISILAGFVLLSGYCYSFGKRKLFRAVQVSVCGIIITAVTWIFMPSQKIIFGVLTCLGLCMLLMIPLEKVLSKLPAAAGILLTLCAALLTYGIRYGYIGIFTYPLFDLPDALYEPAFLFPFGFRNASFRSADYVPLLPWFFVFLCGFYVFKAVRNNVKTEHLLQHGLKPLATVGRYSLWIYMAHQPVIYAVLWLIFKLF